MPYLEAPGGVVKHLYWKTSCLFFIHGPLVLVIPRVQRWIEPGSTVFTDGLRAYKQLPKLPQKYKHDYVCHNEGEWTKETSCCQEQCHTQAIDGLWGRLKAWLRSKHGVHKSKIPGYVIEYERRHRKQKANVFEALLQTLKEESWWLGSSVQPTWLSGMPQYKRMKTVHQRMQQNTFLNQWRC